ncbi:MAG: hypothetical protein WC676_01955 [Candidatus Omnitrophota bacterium]
MIIYCFLLTLPLVRGIGVLFIYGPGMIRLEGPDNYFELWGLFSQFAFCCAQILIFLIGIGLLFRKPWTEFLAKYLYPFPTIAAVPFFAGGLCALGGRGSSIGCILFLSCLSLSFFLAPVLLYFYFPSLKRFNLWFKVLVFILCFSPVIVSAVSMICIRVVHH